ncbi:MAG: MFS transporter [Chloroflexi bacterium]|nr:MFS transporter [Chloroflexota bacterium]
MMFRRNRALPVPLILTVIGLGAFVTALDQTVVVTALPSVMLDLKIPITELDRASWIITAYLLGYTVAMPLIGRVADVYGYPRVYQVSLLVFIAGTTLVALSSNLELMIGARVIQAIGGGATVPIGMAIASSLLPPERRGLALGIVGGAAEAGSMLGPAYGGAIVELSNWRWIFWLNVPQAGVLLLALFWLPNRPNRQARVDYLGGGLLAATLLVVSLAVSREGLFTLTSPLPFLIGAPGVLLAITLGVAQRRTLQPLLPGFLFRSWAFVTANLTQFLVGVSLIIAMVTVPLMANTIMGQDPFTGALWLLRLTGAIPVGAVLGGWLLSKVGVRPVTVTGLALATLGLFLVSTWQIGVAEPMLTLHLVMAGFGFGLVIAPIVTHALNAVSEDYQGTAASLVVVARMMGMTLGLAALSAWGVEHFQALTAGLDLPLPLPGESSESVQARIIEYNDQLNAAGLSLFHNFFRAAAGVSLAAIVPALLMRSDRRG